MTLSDKIVVMHDGIIEQTGTPFEVYAASGQPVCGELLGKANFIEKDGVTYAVRPEKVRIGEESDANARMTGVVEALVYSGNLMTCTVKCQDTEIIAELSNSAEAHRLERGAKVSVLWDDSAQIRLAD